MRYINIQHHNFYKIAIEAGIVIFLSIIISFAAITYSYNSLITALAILAIYYICINLKNDVNRIIIYLTIFLPFYALIRAILLKNQLFTPLTLTAYIRDFLIILALMIVFASKAVMQRKKIDIRFKKNSFLDLGVIILLSNYLYGFIISLIRGNFLLAIKAVHISIIPIFLFYIIKNSKKITEEFLIRFYNIFALMGLIVGISGLFFYFFKPIYFGELFAVFRGMGENPNLIINYGRMVGIFLSPNVFGSFMAIVGILSYTLIGYSRKDYYYVFIFLLSLISVLFSLSRGAWGFLTIGLFVSTLLNLRNKGINKKMILISIILVSFFILSFLLPENIQGILIGRFKSLFETSSSAYQRVIGWSDVLERILYRPDGFGLGIAGYNMINQPELARKLGISVIDGFYVKIIAETGVIGILSFILFIFSVIKLTINSISLAKNWIRLHNIITLSIFSGLLFQFIGSNVLDFIAISPFIWIFIGISNQLYLRNIQICTNLSND